MDAYTTEKFLTLEKKVWSALASGDIATDTRLLADNFLGVYRSGFAEKADHTNQLRAGPTVAHYELSEAQIQVLSQEIVLLSYCAQWVRYNDNDLGGKESMYVTSIWQRIDGAWKNVFSQDTPFGD